MLRIQSVRGQRKSSRTPVARAIQAVMRKARTARDTAVIRQSQRLARAWLHALMTENKAALASMRR
jgi:hypothetical protein